MKYRRHPALSPEYCGVSPVMDRDIVLTGKVEAKKGMWPWIIQLSTEDDGMKIDLCSGVLISEIHALTTAHCFDEFGYNNCLHWPVTCSYIVIYCTTAICIIIYSLKPGPNIDKFENIFFTVGLHNKSSPDNHTIRFSRDDGLLSVVIHEHYNWETIENDIALITLNRKVSFNQFVRPICLLLPTNFNSMNPFDGEPVFIAGWMNNTQV